MRETLLTEELETLRQKSLLRKLRTLTDHRGARAKFEGKEILLFCGNDYLGLSHDPRVIEGVRRTLATHCV